MLRLRGNATVNHSTFFQTEIGLATNIGASSNIQNSTFDGQNLFPIMLSLGSTPTFSNNTFTNNTYDGIGITSEFYNADTFFLKEPTQFGLPALAYILKSFQEVRVRSNSRLEIDPGVVVKCINQYGNLRLEGELLAHATVGQALCVYLHCR